MGGEKQVQKAGDNSNQIQAGTVNITNITGLDENRAREIFNEMYIIARKDFTQDAYDCANERVTKFEKSLLPKMSQIDGALQNFADPSFQLLLTEAHKTAAATERENDYTLLSELLIHRVKKDKNRKVRAGISRAVKIVDEIDDDALCALTVMYTLVKIVPVSGRILDGLDDLEEVFKNLLYVDLPRGSEWLEHLEMLNTIQTTTFRTLMKIREFCSNKLEGYVCTGISKNSENFKKALEVLNENNLPVEILVDHELMDGYVRLEIQNRKKISSLQILESQVIDGQMFESIIDLTKQQKDTFLNIYDLYENSEEQRLKVLDSFMVEWKKRKALKTLSEWWDNIPVSFQITSVGKVLAHANAQRCDKNILPLE